MKLVEIVHQNLAELRKHEGLSDFLNKLDACGPSLILGGAIRDWSFNKVPKDIDIVIDCDSSKLEFLLKYKAQKNVLGGFKLQVDGVKFDIWALSNTWALQNDVKFNKNIFVLPKTVFLNIDSVGYCSDTKEIYENGFFQALETKSLDIIYEPNPYPFFCVSKSLCASLKYGLHISDNLKQYITNQMDRGYTKKSFIKYNELNGLNYDYEDARSRL